MSEKKEEIRYILKFYYKKGRMRFSLLKKFVIIYDAVSVRGTKLVQAFSIWKL